MTIKQLAKEIARREGLKKSVDIAQIQEILGHLSDILYPEDEGVTFYVEDQNSMRAYEALIRLGEKRAQKRKKK